MLHDGRGFEISIGTVGGMTTNVALGALLIAGMTMAATPAASASPGYFGSICIELNDSPSFDTLDRLIYTDSMVVQSPADSARDVANAVDMLCPEFKPLVRSYFRSYFPQ